MENLVLIDSNAIIHRSYHALPKSMSNRAGLMTNVVYGYATTLLRVLEEIKPEYVVACFDLSGPTFRHEAYKEYKATRVKADQELYDQIPLVREFLDCLDIKVFEQAGFEADDCIGTIVEKVRNDEKDVNVYIVTGDKDIFQLLNGKVFVYWLKKGLSDTAIVDGKKIEEEFNLQPEDFIDLKALAGDSSDNIPGIPGIGPKTATDLIIKFDSLVKLYERIEGEFIKDSPDFQFAVFDFQSEDNEQLIKSIAQNLDIKERTLRLLGQHKEQAFMSQHLATIDKHVPFEFSLEDVKWGDHDKGALREFFQKVGFKSLLKRFGAEESTEPKTKKAKVQREKDNQLSLL